MDDLHFLHGLIGVEEIKEGIAKGLLLIEDPILRAKLTKFVLDGIDGSVGVIKHLAECREKLAAAQFQSRMKKLAGAAVVAQLRLVQEGLIALTYLLSDAEKLFKAKISDADEQSVYHRALHEVYRPLVAKLQKEFDDNAWLDEAMADPFDRDPKK